MDSVRAKAVLEQFADAFKAARELADALNVAVGFERREIELRANLEHLGKEQTRAQTEAKSRAEQADRDIQAAYAGFDVQRQKLQAELTGLADQVNTRRAAFEAELVDQKDRLDRAVLESQAMVSQLQAETAAKQQEAADLDRKIESLKNQARRLLS